MAFGDVFQKRLVYFGLVASDHQFGFDAAPPLRERRCKGQATQLDLFCVTIQVLCHCACIQRDK
jgi:hypothetical protein